MLPELLLLAALAIPAQADDWTGYTSGDYIYINRPPASISGRRKILKADINTMVFQGFSPWYWQVNDGDLELYESDGDVRADLRGGTFAFLFYRYHASNNNSRNVVGFYRRIEGGGAGANGLGAGIGFFAPNDSGTDHALGNFGITFSDVTAGSEDSGYFFNVYSAGSDLQVLGADAVGVDVFNALLLTDGVTAPSTVSGKAIIYVDTADGDLKVKFGDGFTATLAADS